MKVYLIIFLIFFYSLAGAQNLISGKIPIDSARWYQLNNTSIGSISPLFNGVVQENVNLGYGLILKNWEAWYPLMPGEVIQIDSLRMFNHSGIFSTQPTTIYAVDDQWQRTLIATFIGVNNNSWQGPNPNQPNQFKLATSISNIRYLIINTFGNVPSELEFYGKYSPPTSLTTSPNLPTGPKNYALKNMSGVNGFEWDFLNSDGSSIRTKSLQLANGSFTGFRHYLDWQKLEDSEGQYTFNPCRSGSWNLDTLYATLKQADIEVLACIKTIPNWLTNTYPSGNQDYENNPVVYGSDLANPQSYIAQAKVVFQYAARYGSNTKVNPALISLNQTPRWTADPINQPRIGLNLIKYIECNNETDRWWKGRYAYQTGREYAANLSAFYDGNLNTMGPGVGAKNADPNIKIVMSGTALASPDYFRGMIDWCAQYRGFLPDGTVNCCWDIINYHYYNTNGSNGIAPEISNFESIAAMFVKASSEFGKNMPVWITETGYDISSNYGSTQYAIPIGNKTILQTQADWIVRTSLLSSRAGIAKTFFYIMYDINSSGGQYGTCGLLDTSRRPSAKYLNQINQKFGNYIFQENLQHNPEVDRYVFNKQSIYVMWSPTQNATTNIYNLKLNSMDSASVYQLNADADSMKLTMVKNGNSGMPLTVTETPIFVVPHLHQVDIISFSIKSIIGKKVTMNWTVSADSSVQKFTIERMNESTKIFAAIGTIMVNSNFSILPEYSFTDSIANDGINHYRLKVTLDSLTSFYSNIEQAYIGSVLVYPNPFTNNINIEGLKQGNPTQIKIYSPNGSLVKVASTNAYSFQMYLDNLASGIYILVADDGIVHQCIRIQKMP